MLPRLFATARVTTIAALVFGMGCTGTIGGDGSSDSASTPTNGVQSGDETDVDCGGANAPKCTIGKKCKVNTDCTTSNCIDGVCKDPTGLDGIKNGDESDVDCGGSTTGAVRCATNKACGTADDCESHVCNAPTKTCSAPTSTDGVKNGDETDTDCGGTTTSAPKCDVGKSCAAHADCALDGCDDTKHCASGRSCTQYNGGRTCGVGEEGAAGAVHESCCGALPLPNGTTKLDKYKVTAGRMRAFIDRVNGDVLGWYETNKTTLSDVVQTQIEAYKASLPSDRTTFPLGSDYQLGSTIYLPQRPSKSQGCGVGNAAAPAYGAHTFHNGSLESEDFAFDQDFRDRLPLNCVPYPLLAAFCAWDGGRLETFDEHANAFGTTLFPWGATPIAGGFQNFPDENGPFTQVGPANFGAGNPIAACPSCDVTLMNWNHAYQVPEGGDPKKPWDYAYWISPPGRFAMDKGPAGHMDVAGLMMEITASTAGTDTATDLNGQQVTQTMLRWSKNGSWEGHAMGNLEWKFAFMTKYGKTGGRCARD